jgi:hypothetical protein
MSGWLFFGGGRLQAFQGKKSSSKDSFDCPILGQKKLAAQRNEMITILLKAYKKY